MRTFMQLGFMVLSSAASAAMAQSMHPPVTTFPINDASQVQPLAATPASRATVAPAAVPASTPPVAATRPVVAAAPAPAPVVMAPATPAGTSTSRPRITEHVGDVTRQLLAAQAQGVRAGIEQPMLGSTATAAWERYINSFKHPIPEWFERTVDTD